MTNEHVANIAITVTAAMLATAAVAFTLSGNAPAGPGSADLPIVSVGTVPAKTPTPGVTAPLAPATSTATPAAGTVPEPRAPFTAAKPSGGSAAISSGSAVSAASAASTGSTVDKGHGSDEKDHEVVVPKVHETDEHDRESGSSEVPPKD